MYRVRVHSRINNECHETDTYFQKRKKALGFMKVVEKITCKNKEIEKKEIKHNYHSNTITVMIKMQDSDNVIIELYKG